MNLSKAGKLVLLAGLLCFLLMGFTGASYAQIPNTIRWDVFPSPSEVITTGRSEVLGSISLYVQQGQSTVVTGNSLGGPTQIGISYSNNITIDNGVGIRVYAPRFPTATLVTATVQNLNITGRCQGFITLNIPPGINMFAGDVIRVDGVRGRIDLSDGANAGTNLYAQMQSVNDPSANMFFPETIRVATSYPGMLVTAVTPATATLCLMDYGKSTGGTDAWSRLNVPAYGITIQEGFVRAFVAADSNIAGPDATDRTDSGGQLLGQASWNGTAYASALAVGTRMRVIVHHLPASVTLVDWPTPVNGTGAFSQLKYVTGTYTFVPGVTNGANSGWSWATYEYFTNNQAGLSDTTLESFVVIPGLKLGVSNQADVGTVYAGATLTGAPGGSGSTLESWSSVDCNSNAPQSIYKQPRFSELWQSYNAGYVSSSDKLSITFGKYADFARCVCYLLYPYVTVDKGVPPPPGTFNWDTGISVSNTTDDVAWAGTANGAPRQTGTVTFYLYDNKQGYIGNSTDSVIYGPGKGFAGLLSAMIAPLQAGFPGGYVANGGFHGYMVAKAEFQFCHGYAFISDSFFNNISQGYVANVIPDPLVKIRNTPTAAADVVTRMPAGESLNN